MTEKAKPNWLHLCMLLVASLLFNNAFATPSKFVRQNTEQVQQVVATKRYITPYFIQKRQLALDWFRLFAEDNNYRPLNTQVQFKQQLLLCLNISQAPPRPIQFLPKSEDTPDNNLV